MKEGDRVISTVEVDCSHMFPEKGDDPEQLFLEKGLSATVEQIFTSGAGIIAYDNGKRVMFFNISEKFELIEGSEA